MKRENDFDWDLRAAFPDMPEKCRDAALNAARSVREERKMKRITLRAALIAALIIVATTTAAMAATDALGWTDFFTLYDNTTVPRAAQEIMNATEIKTYEVGPLSFTVRQMLCDGRLAMAAADIRTADGSDALFCEDPYDILACNGENGKALAKRLNLPEDTTFLDAARQLDLPLYWPQFGFDMDQDYSAGEAMGDHLWNEDNSMTAFFMLYLDQEKTQDMVSLPAVLNFYLARIDLETGEPMADTVVHHQEPIEIPVQGVVAEKDFAPVAPFTLNGYTLLSVHAEQTVAGLYLDRAYEADEEAKKIYETAGPDETFDIVCDLWEGVWVQENGQGFPEGISLSGEYDDKDFPLLHFRDMISVDKMPDTLILETAGQQVTLK